MSKNISDLPDQPLKTRKVEYVTGSGDFTDLPFSADDLKSLDIEEMPLEVPDDRQLINAGGYLFAMPKDMNSVLNKFDEPKKALSRRQRTINFLLKIFRVKHAK